VNKDKRIWALAIILLAISLPITALIITNDGLGSRSGSSPSLIEEYADLDHPIQVVEISSEAYTPLRAAEKGCDFSNYDETFGIDDQYWTKKEKVGPNTYIFYNMAWKVVVVHGVAKKVETKASSEGFYEFLNPGDFISQASAKAYWHSVSFRTMKFVVVEMQPQASDDVLTKARVVCKTASFP
jgi:hypothetical protein